MFIFVLSKSKQITAYSRLTQFETEPQIELEWFTCKVIKVDEEDFIAEVYRWEANKLIKK